MSNEICVHYEITRAINSSEGSAAADGVVKGCADMHHRGDNAPTLLGTALFCNQKGCRGYYNINNRKLGGECITKEDETTHRNASTDLVTTGLSFSIAHYASERMLAARSNYEYLGDDLLGGLGRIAVDPKHRGFKA